MSNDHQPHGAGSSDDLRGLEILLVEDSWVVGDAVKQLLELLGANVSGPAASIAEAEHLLAQHLPDVALVDDPDHRRDHPHPHQRPAGELRVGVGADRG